MGEVTRFPRRTLVGSLLCRVGWHKWMRTGATQVVIPTGSALLIKRRHQPVLCARFECAARRDEIYDRDEK
jgi:hypothetical protein